jgi:hypothetical protein
MQPGVAKTSINLSGKLSSKTRGTFQAPLSCRLPQRKKTKRLPLNIQVSYSLREVGQKHRQSGKLKMLMPLRNTMPQLPEHDSIVNRILLSLPLATLKRMRPALDLIDMGDAINSRPARSSRPT